MRELHGPQEPAIFCLLRSLGFGGNVRCLSGTETSDPMNGTIVKNTDRDLQRRVRAQLERNDLTDRAQIDVEAIGGSVTLTGSTPDAVTRQAVGETARRVAGVRTIANHLEIHPQPGHTPKDSPAAHDQAVASAIRSVLQQDALIPYEHLHSNVADGWVTIEGRVGSDEERRRVLQTLEEVPGVEGIVDKITIADPQREVTLERAVRHAVLSTLERRARAEADHIRFQIEDGHVSLLGKVHSWQEREAVLHAVGHTPGVSLVEDCLVIQPYF